MHVVVVEPMPSHTTSVPAYTWYPVTAAAPLDSAGALHANVDAVPVADTSAKPLGADGRVENAAGGHLSPSPASLNAATTYWCDDPASRPEIVVCVVRLPLPSYTTVSTDTVCSPVASANASGSYTTRS